MYNTSLDSEQFETEFCRNTNRNYSDIGQQDPCCSNLGPILSNSQLNNYLNWNQKSLKKKTKSAQGATQLLYDVDSSPPLPIMFLLGLQHYITMFGSTVVVPILLAPYFCIQNNPGALSQVMSTLFFASGISTLIQTSVGSRLPIIQGATFALLKPTMDVLSMDRLSCNIEYTYRDSNANTSGNTMQQIEHVDWTTRMREIQGGIIAASILQILLGLTGIVGLVCQYIRPITFAITISSIGLSLVKPAGEFSSSHWGLAFLTVTLMIGFLQLAKKISIIKPFPIILSLVVAGSISAVLERYGQISIDKSNNISSYAILYEAPWIHISYPGQWGTPIFSIVGSSAMSIGILVSIIESVGNYISCAKISEVRQPPRHAINRGIAMEGVASMFAGMCGSGNGTTSYSENIAAIGVTRVASRRVIQMGALIMIGLSFFPKIGAVFALLPKAVIGGMFWVLFGMIFSVGMSLLQFVDLNSNRNLLVLGFSMFSGMVVPTWVNEHPESISTGFEDLDQILRILLCTNMMVGGLCAFLLDNILPNDDSIIKSDNEDKNIQSTIFKKKGIFRNLKDRISKAQGSNYAFFNIKSDSQEPDIELGCSESQLFATQLRHDARSNWHNYKTFAESFRKQEIEQTGEEEDANVYELPYFWGYLNRQWWVDYMPFLPDRKTEN